MATLAVARATALTYKTRIKALIEESKKEENKKDGKLSKRLQVYRDYYREARNEIAQLSVSEEETRLLIEEAETEANFMLDIEDCIADLQFQTDERDRASVVSSSRSTELRAKLPTLTLSTFNGDYLQFTSYWGSFQSSVDTRTDISVIDKFNYLFNSLTNGSNACIAGLERTEENYVKAKDRIYRRYGDVQMRINAHMNALQEVKACGVSTVALRANYDAIETHLGNIESLGETLTDKTLLGLLKNKFPAAVIIAIEESLDDTEKLTVEKFRSKLHRYISVRERCESFTVSHDGKPEFRSGARGKFQRSFSNPNSGGASGRSSPNYSPAGARKPNNACIFCGDEHWNDDCPKFTSVAARKNQVRGRCFNCFSRNHRQDGCINIRECRHCGGKDHHRSLCEAYLAKANIAVNLVGTDSANPPNDDKEDAAVLVAVMSSNTEVYLPAAPVVISALNQSKAIAVKMLMDTGSQMTFVSQRVASLLHLKPTGRITINLFRFGSSVPITSQCPKADLIIHFKGNQVKIPVVVVPYITNRLLPPSYYQDIQFAVKKYPQIRVAYPKPDDNVEVLIGANLYYYFIGPRLLSVRPGLFLSETKFGWLLVGQERPVELLAADVFSFLANCHESKGGLAVGLPYSVQMTKLWDLDALGIGQEQDRDEDEAVRCFNNALTYVNNRYQISWPWRRYPPELPNNYGLAFGRLKSLVRRIQEDGIMAQYDQTINEQLRNGIVEKLETRANGLEHYLPHQYIFKNEKTTALRIVFDASSKTRKTVNSLNDCMYKGRVLLEDLLQILLRFRMHESAVVSDVEKAFLQLELKTEEDKDVVRFLWLKDPSRPVEDRNVQLFRFRRVVFGVVASPFLLNAIIRYHVTKALDKFPELKCVPESIYVDNLVMSGNSTESFKKLYASAKHVFNEASMNLREWYSNDNDLLGIIRDEDRPQGGKSVADVLGLSWDVKADTLRLRGVKSGERGDGVFSKTTVLETVASLYDPLGLVSPVSLAGKLFIRKLWQASYDWDKILDDQLTCEWLKLRELIKVVVARFSIPRWVRVINYDVAEIHCFVDASQQAYATAIYVREVRGDVVITNLIFSKARVAPLESKNKPKLSIPRLELLGATIGARAIETVRKSLPNVKRTLLWSDSQCVLKWLHSTKILPVFEENRIRQIKRVGKVEYRYVPTELNPADLATRSKLDPELVDSPLWRSGPLFLAGPETQWPDWEVSAGGGESGETEVWGEDVFSAVVVAETSAQLQPPFGIDIRKFNSVNRLLRVTAYCIRFIEGRNSKFQVTQVEAEEMDRALIVWVEYMQRVEYGLYFLPNNIKKPAHPLKLWMEDKTFLFGRELRMSPRMRAWKGEQILRCATRLGNAALTTDEQNPILLPRKHTFTHLLIFDMHVASCHAGPNNTLARLRERFYIPKGKSEVRKIISNCVACKKATVGPYIIPPMAPWPAERVNKSAPFTYCGLDGLGPFPMKTKEGNVNVYILIITCLVTRAVYLVLLENLTAEVFLHKLREFIGRRTCPELIVCDNARSFKAVASVSSRMWLRVVKEELISRFSVEGGRRIRWRFIPELSPWAGGVYERLIGLFKNCYKRTIGMIVMSRSQLEATIGEIQGILNSRPLCEINEEEYLTPGHFLNTVIVSRGPVIDKTGPVPSTRIRAELLSAWRRGNRILDMFWKLWRSHYLRALGERRNWKIKQGRIVSPVAPKVGEPVLIGDSAPRQEWKVGVIQQVHRGSDGFIRSATVKTMGGGVYHRSVGHLYPYENNLVDVTRINEQSSQVKEPTHDNSATASDQESAYEATFTKPTVVHVADTPPPLPSLPGLATDGEGQPEDSEGDDQRTPRPDVEEEDGERTPQPSVPITPSTGKEVKSVFFTPNAEVWHRELERVKQLNDIPSPIPYVPLPSDVNMPTFNLLPGETSPDKIARAPILAPREPRAAAVAAKDKMMISSLLSRRGLSPKAKLEKPKAPAKPKAPGYNLDID